MSPTWLAGAVLPAVDRNEPVPEVLRALSSSHQLGAIIVGKPGVGKSFLLHEALSKTEVDQLAIHMRGTALSTDKPFAALSFLMGELGLSFELDPHDIVDALAPHLREMADRKQIVLVVENADALDAASAEVVAQLALNRSAKLLVACRDLTRCPPSLRTLWLEGALARVDLDCLPLAEAQQLLTTALDGVISRRALHALWDASSGNPRLMQLLVQDFVSSGRLVRHGDIWVRGRGPVEVSQATADAVMAHLGALTPEQLALLEMLALAGSMPLSLASTLGSVGDLDHLRGVGAIELGRDPQQLVIVGYLVGLVIRNQVGAFARVGHLARLREQSPDGVPPIHPVRHAEWVLECGLPLGAEIALRAATLANDHHDTETALRLLGSATGEGEAALPLLLETARAHIKAEDLTSAATVMGEFEKAARTVIPKEELALLENPKNRALRVRMEAARSILAAWNSRPLGSSGPAARIGPEPGSILLAQMEQAATEGRFTDIASTLRKTQKEWSADGPEMALQLTGLLALADAVTDGQHEAHALSEELAASLQHVAVPPRVRARLVFWLQLVSLVTGGAGQVPQNQPSVSADGTAGELMDGVTLALQGRHEEALELLVPALAQLHVSDPAGLRCTAAAATAYCYALQGESGKVRPLMFPLEDRTAQASIPQFALRYFRALTLVQLGSTAEARRMLSMQAEEEKSAGRSGLEVVVRAELVCLGDRDAAAELVAAAARTQGPFSDLCALLGEGVRSRKPNLLADAAKAAEAMGSYGFAEDIRELLRKLAVASGDRTLTKKIRRATAASGFHPNASRSGAQLNLLTPREREVARLARSGLSNKEIAARLHVSIRTVEGHLYQIYVKIGVSSRNDLLAALDGEAS
ncbi:AAA family ATPase [Arthrobacter sp. JZ12]|uniref:helix-turn-helix transcriptional regulator n=1 Tax=Arthrobacter sp. JZ12 TaxID=2654190 RepID=UPI002B47D194|nr:LuxR C-terminal-related transcriptional regulator [Arthrobacter sp. JZ12]WRH24409.1 AAA family ATPase [Arthrobacter sp. JZ12]